MSISPKFLSHKLGTNGVNTVEFYVDYVCPFSAKLYKRLVEEVIPAVSAQLPGRFQFIFRHQVQPWHPSSTLVHEAGLAVAKLNPDKFWDFSTALFEESRDFYDENAYHENRFQTYGRLADLANRSVGIDRQKLLDLLIVPEIEKGDIAHNKGNQVTADLRTFVRQARQNGIHVSPTVVINGIIDSSFESSTPVDTWLTKLKDVNEASKL